MAKATRSPKSIEEIMASAPQAQEILADVAGTVVPEDVATVAATDSQNAGVAQALRRAIEYRVDPRFVRGRAKRVRLQSGELIDLASPRGRKLFEAEKLEEEKAIQKRKDFNQELLGIKSRAKWERDQSRRRINDRITKAQMRGAIGRAAYGAGRGAARVRNELSGLSDIVPGRRNPLVRFGLRYGKNIGGVRGGLAGLGALAGGALIGKAIQAFGEDREAEAQRQEMLRRQARQDMLDMLGRKEQKRALQMSIDDNLAKLQAQAPDLYMRVASGRLLPQGAVVIGGVPRQDLLNQLGMAMSNGQFSE